MDLRRWGLVVSVGSALLVTGAACSSSNSSSGSGGAGGGGVQTGGVSGGLAGTTGAAGGTTGSAGGTTGGNAGATGTAGTSGAAGSAGTVSCGTLPACVASLAAACPVASSACLIFDTASGNTSTQNICFGNPATVKVTNVVTNDPNTGAGSQLITAYKSGSPCYTLDGTYNSDDPVTTPRLLSFKNSLGVEVATFSTDVSTYPNPTTVTCAGGQPVLVTDFGNCGMPNHPEPDFCTGGLCTVP